MKKSIYDQSKPKDNMMLAALKQAVANLKAANDSSVRDNNVTAKPAEQAPVNPLQLAQVERKLDAADRNIPMNKNQSESGGKIYEKTPKSRDFQQHDYYNHQERERIQALENAKTQKAFERKIRNILYGEPLVDKPVPRDNGVYDAGDAWRNPTYAGGALAKNGVNRESVGEIFCSDEFEFEWTRSTVASWVRQRLTILPAEKITSWAEITIHATPLPTDLPRPTPRPTETPWPTPMPRPTASPAVTAKAEQQTTDPLVFAFAGVLALVIAGIVVVAVKSGRPKKRAHKK